MSRRITGNVRGEDRAKGRGVGRSLRSGRRVEDPQDARPRLDQGYLRDGRTQALRGAHEVGPDLC